MLRASLYAVAVMAFARPRRAAIRRKKAPRALCDRWRFFAASRKTWAAQFTPGRVALDFTLPLDFLGFGASPSQLPQCCSLGHRLLSVPISLNTTRAVLSSMALQEGTCDITPFSLLHCRVNSYRLTWRK